MSLIPGGRVLCLHFQGRGAKRRVLSALPAGGDVAAAEQRLGEGEFRRRSLTEATQVAATPKSKADFDLKTAEVPWKGF